MIVVWRITTHCNLACPFCAYDRTRTIPRNHADPATVRAFCQILADYQCRHRDPVMLSWLGGEPLLWPALPRLTEQAVALGLRVSATTNGTTLGSAVVRRHLLDHYAELTISLDAPDATHDRLRAWPNGFDSLRTTVPALIAERAARRRPLKVRINTLLQRSSIAAFPLLAREVARWGADGLTFNALGGRDRPEYFPAERLFPGQLLRFASALPDLRENLGRCGLAIQGSSVYLERLLAGAGGDLHPVADCAPGERFLFIDEGGRVSPCSFTSQGLGVPLSGLGSAADIAALPVRFQELRNAHKPAACLDCPSTQFFQKFVPSAA